MARVYRNLLVNPRPKKMELGRRKTGKTNCCLVKVEAGEKALIFGYDFVTCAMFPSLNEEFIAELGWLDKFKRDKNWAGSPLASQRLLAFPITSGVIPRATSHDSSRAR
jgi:hypothetical protein